MDWKRFDAIRHDSGPIELDLIEAYAARKIDRRDFVKRGTIIGLSTPLMATVIAACGDSSGDGDGGTSAGDDDGGDSNSSDDGGGGGSGGNLVVAIQAGDADSGLDPVNMLDLGTYGVVSQSFEYLVGLGDDGNIAPTALATEWSPNEDGSVWTFTLREGVMWADGSEFTSADVAATMDRLATAENAGLAGVIEPGAVDSSDPTQAVFTLVESNGNFPVLVSIFNAQSLIAPADYSVGTTLDGRPAGTGPWILDDFNAGEFVARYVPNPNWWGGALNLDSQEFRGFEDVATAVTAMQSKEVDAIQNFSVLGGEGLLADDSFTLLTPPAANHRQVWFHTQNGQFTDPRVRQAMALTFDRPQLVDTLFDGRAEIGNDHPILSTLPFFDADATPQRERNIEMARQLLADAGFEDGLTSVINVGNLQEIPEYAALIQQNAAEAGFTLSVDEQDNSTFYGDSWCPASDEPVPTQPCAPADEFGIVDYGHRPIPDIFLSSALSTDGVWNSSNYANPEFDAELSNYRTAVDVDGQKSAIGNIQKILHEDTPAVYAYFFNYLSGHDSSVSGIEVTSLGHMITSGASKS